MNNDRDAGTVVSSSLDWMRRRWEEATKKIKERIGERRRDMLPPPFPVKKAAAQLGVSLVSFVVLTRTVQLIGGALKITSGSRIAPFIGAVAVAGCAVAGRVASDAIQLDNNGHFALRFIPHRHFSLELLTGSAIMGLLFFRLLGWRCKTIFPSDLRTIGSFNRDPMWLIKKKRPSPYSLPATQEYANDYERGSIAAIGRLVGCHSCGTKSSQQWIADHIPPNHFVNQATKWYHKMIGISPSMPQRFYPHCSDCMALQSVAVKKNFPRPVYNLSRLRSSDLTAVGGTILSLINLGIGSPYYL